MTMGHHEKTTAAERQIFSLPSRYWLIWRRGERKAAKIRFNRRARRKIRQSLNA